MMFTWCRERKAWIAIALAAFEGKTESLKITLQTYKPALRQKGSERCPPAAQGGDSKASVLPKRHSVEVDSQSLLTDKSESRNDGTQRTLRK
eukprot:4027338-Pleurochrysis_carterae.AAC.1